MALLETVNCLKNTHMPIRSIKQYIDWVVEGDNTIEHRHEMMKNHKQAVLAEIAVMTEALKGIDVKIARYTKRIHERNEVI